MSDDTEQRVGEYYTRKPLVKRLPTDVNDHRNSPVAIVRIPQVASGE